MAIRLYEDKYTPTGLMLTLFRPPENATNGPSQDIQKFLTEKIQNFLIISRGRSFVDKSGFMLTSGLVLTLVQPSEDAT